MKKNTFILVYWFHVIRILHRVIGRTMRIARILFKVEDNIIMHAPALKNVEDQYEKSSAI